MKISRTFSGERRLWVPNYRSVCGPATEPHRETCAGKCTDAHVFLYMQWNERIVDKSFVRHELQCVPDVNVHRGKLLFPVFGPSCLWKEIPEKPLKSHSLTFYNQAEHRYHEIHQSFVKSMRSNNGNDFAPEGACDDSILPVWPPMDTVWKHVLPNCIPSMCFSSFNALWSPQTTNTVCAERGAAVGRQGFFLLVVVSHTHTYPYWPVGASKHQPGPSAGWRRCVQWACRAEQRQKTMFICLFVYLTCFLLCIYQRTPSPCTPTSHNCMWEYKYMTSCLLPPAGRSQSSTNNSLYIKDGRDTRAFGSS